jgi:hypothetical protein
MAELVLGLVAVLGWLVMAGYLNYKVWLKPDEMWRVQQEEQSRAPGGEPGLFRRFMHQDAPGLMSHRGRFLWFERVVAAVVLLLGIAMLAGVIVGQLGK